MFHFILNFDIFFVCETWVTIEKCKLYEKKFVGTHKIFWNFAAQGERGRPAGGMLLGIKTNICSDFDMHKYADFFVLTGKINKVKFALFFVYFSCTRWQQIMDEVDTAAGYFSELEYAILLMGDCNARVGGEDSLTDISTLPINNACGKILNCKKSQDTVCNGRGKTLLELCVDHNMIILNGRKLCY